MSETAPAASVSQSHDAEITAALGTRCVVLVGMMGAGKSTIGRRMAARLRLPFLDADTEIEAAAGMTSPEIFAAHGEPYFRDGEARVIARLLDNGPAVIATGGGAFVDESTRALILERTTAIWLNADIETLVERVGRRGGRPLLASGDPAETLRRLAALRAPFYAQAPIHIESRPAPHDSAVDAIVAALRQQGMLDDRH